MKKLGLLVSCFTLSLVLVFGTVLSSSRSIFADDMMGGTMDGGGGNDGNSMPPPEDAPATTDTLIAGGGSDDDDDNESDDDSGRDDDDGDDNDNDSEPTSADAPVTTDALKAKKIECPPDQEVTLFSTICKPSEPDSTQGSTLDVTACPASPAPTSYYMSDQSSISYAKWEFNNNDGYDIKTGKLSTQQTLLHQAATPINPPVTTKDLQTYPGLRAICTGKPVLVTNPDGTVTSYSPRTGKIDRTFDAYGKGSGKYTSYDFNEKTGKLEGTYESNPATGQTSYSDYDPNGRLKESGISSFGSSTKNIYDPQTGKLKETEHKDVTGSTTKTTFDTNGKPISQTKQQSNKDGKPVANK